MITFLELDIRNYFNIRYHLSIGARYWHYFGVSIYSINSWIYLVLDTKIVFRIEIALIQAGHFVAALQDGLIVNFLQRVILRVVVTEDWVVVPANISDI